MPKVTLSGYFVVPAEDLTAVEAELPNHIRLTNEEPGCLSFRIAQSEADPNRFDVAEVFASPEAFESHKARIATSHWATVTANAERHYEIEEVPD